MKLPISRARSISMWQSYQKHVFRGEQVRARCYMFLLDHVKEVNTNHLVYANINK